MPWADVVKSTKTGDAHYKSGLPRSIETIEEECIATGNELPFVIPAKRRFWMQLDFIVGASKGEETGIVYAEWPITNGVHGRPITENELKKKGKQ